MDRIEFEIKTSNFLGSYKPLNFVKTNWHLLYDTETSRILAIAKSLPAINLLAENTFSSEPWYFVNKKTNRLGNSFFPPTWKFEKPWEWKLDRLSTMFDFVPIEQNYDLLFKFVLVSTKAYILDKIHSKINIMRRPFLNEYLNGQQLIYEEKYKEAQSILGNEDTIESNYPFISDYARLTQIDIRIAAEEVVQQYKFQRANLQRSEFIRIKYSKAVINSNELFELKALMVNFDQETSRSVKR